MRVPVPITCHLVRETILTAGTMGKVGPMMGARKHVAHHEATRSVTAGSHVRRVSLDESTMTMLLAEGARCEL